MGSAHARERDFAEMIAQREQLPPDDTLVHMVAALFSTCSQQAGKTFFSDENTASFGDLLAANLRAAQQIFNFSHLTFEGTP